jgi:DNA-binding MarR family transcriptional regulator
VGTNRDLFLKEATASEYVGRIVEHQLAPVGIPGYLLAILTHVRDLTPVSPTEISRVSGVPLTTLRDNIQRLVERKLVRRRANPADGRSYLVVLTPRGRAVAHDAGEALYAAYLALERHLPRPREQYEGMLDELNASLELALADLLGVGEELRTGTG